MLSSARLTVALSTAAPTLLEASPPSRLSGTFCLGHVMPAPKRVYNLRLNNQLASECLRKHRYYEAVL